MYRKAMASLEQWKNSSNRKPLIIRGARQVGKTWLMQEFGRMAFKNTAYINFDNNSPMRNLFEADFDIDRIVQGFETETQQDIGSETLIILDEIQEAPKALTSLKYFHETAPEHHIIAAGSLLGVSIHPEVSFPVGKVDFLDLYPMDFSEFLRALSEEKLTDLLETGDFSLITVFKEKYIEALKQYYYVGGMPEAVNSFTQDKNYREVRRIQQNLLRAYEQDFTKHAPPLSASRIRMVWKNIPSQLAKENKKFLYGLIKSGARAREYEAAIDWLCDAGLVHRIYRVTKPGLPLSHYTDLKAFKIYFLDVGLLSAASELNEKTILNRTEIFQEFKGALTEQFVCQQLLPLTVPYYWSTENSSGEIDILIQLEDDIIPVEVKASENLKAKSLKSFSLKYNPRLAVRASLSDYREEDWMINLPLYAVNRIGEL